MCRRIARSGLPGEHRAMSEVTFSNIAPVIPVTDLNRALRRYRLLGPRL
jgi:hypothetical protein